jgi:hypothetical protein
MSETMTLNSLKAQQAAQAKDFEDVVRNEVAQAREIEHRETEKATYERIISELERLIQGGKCGVNFKGALDTPAEAAARRKKQYKIAAGIVLSLENTRRQGPKDPLPQCDQVDPRIIKIAVLSEKMIALYDGQKQAIVTEIMNNPQALK